jgi:hypothetical protein
MMDEARMTKKESNTGMSEMTFTQTDADALAAKLEASVSLRPNGGCTAPSSTGQPRARTPRCKVSPSSWDCRL